MHHRRTGTDLFGDMILPKTRSLVKLKVVTFGNGNAWPVIR